MNLKTVVTTAEGDVKQFGDFLSKFIVGHPKLAAIVFGCIGVAVGWFVRGL